MQDQLAGCGGRAGGAAQGRPHVGIVGRLQAREDDAGDARPGHGDERERAGAVGEAPEAGADRVVQQPGDGGPVGVAQRADHGPDVETRVTPS